VSRGPGRCQRRIIELLKGAPERRLSRAALEEVLVAGEGYDASNVLRSIRRLERVHHVIVKDERHKAEAVVCLPREVEHLTDDELADLLAEIRGSK
jgi:CBS domain containing-hemolysin-like protein